jgi:phosphatidylserine/phosphatidylglycerophosphate/cardiolipin synthase-like enzyme
VVRRATEGIRVLKDNNLKDLFHTSILFFLLTSAGLHAQLPIAQARDLPPGTVVTVRGIATNGAELGKVRYVQDATAGLAVFPGTGSAPGFEAAVGPGDSVEVTGPLVSYHGLLEISPVTAYTVIAPDLPLPAPVPATLAELGEDLEGQLVSIECVHFAQGGSAWFAGGGLYTLEDASGVATELYVRNGHPLTGTAVPAGKLQLRAIVSDYDGRQLLVRSAADWSAAGPCFHFETPPRQSLIETNGFQLQWKTSAPAAAWLRYGPSAAQLDQLAAAPGSGSEQAYTLAGLEPGRIYWVEIIAVSAGGDTARTAVRPYATRSLSSGEIRVYFNQAIDPVAAGGLSPAGQSPAEVLAAIIERLDAAELTIDVAVFSNTRDDLTDALKAAHERGVRVRYVAAANANSPALLPPPLFPVLYGNTGSLMHNKFVVIDADLPQQAWVVTGSMNWSGGIIYDYNNAVFVQDQSLARAYELEFEELWGGGGEQPNAALARFGSAKADNTPHDFVIGGRAVQSFFSPSDHTTAQIEAALRSADVRVEAAVYVFTHGGPGQALLERHDAAVAVRAMTESFDDFSSELEYLQSQGMAVQEHTLQGILHHKYAVVDAGAPAFDPLVVTGSHNWTYTAESANDENTLIIHDAAIAQLYAAEFEQRWQDLTPTAAPTGGQRDWSVYPNPAGDWLQLASPAPGPVEHARVRIVDATGVERLRAAGPADKVDLRALPAGFYVLLVQSPHGTAAVPFQKI